jgi:hypothetical protein
MKKAAVCPANFPNLPTIDSTETGKLILEINV